MHYLTILCIYIICYSHIHLPGLYHPPTQTPPFLPQSPHAAFVPLCFDFTLWSTGQDVKCPWSLSDSARLHHGAMSNDFLFSRSPRLPFAARRGARPLSFSSIRNWMFSAQSCASHMQASVPTTPSQMQLWCLHLLCFLVSYSHTLRQ